MARLSAQAMLGYVPLPPTAATLIATYLAPAPPDAHILDPCAGEGHAISAIADAIGIAPDRRYLNEPHDERRQACRERVPQAQVLGADALRTLQASRGLFQLAYLNPPFDSAGAEQGGGRLEPQFFRRVVEEGQWLQPGGLAIYVTPQDILLRDACLKHLARCLDDIRLYRLPPAIRRFREVVVFGVLRRQWRVGGELRRELAAIAARLMGELPVLSHQATPLYLLPTPQPISSIIWRDADTATPAQAHADVLATGGAWPRGHRRHACARPRSSARSHAPSSHPRACRLPSVWLPGASMGSR